MYPRDAASPPEIAVGAVVQISDGAVQTSDTTTKVKPKGGAWTAAGGTTSFGDGGTATYIPIQAETNYESFMVEVYKSGCIPASATVVTSASATAGQTVVATNNDKTGYGLADDAITSAKFDESTAFPLKSADTGATAVARTGSGSDTLETLSDQMDALPAGVRDVSNAAPAAGSLGEKVNSAASAGDPLASSVPGAYEAGTAGYILGTNLDAKVSEAGGGAALTVEEIRAEIDSNSTRLASIDGKTTNLPSDPADQSLVIAATDAILTRLGAPAGASMSDDIANIVADLGTIVPTTDAPDAEVVAKGTVIAGSYVNCQTDDNNQYTIAPVNPGGIDVELDFTIVGSRAPVSLSINGYFKGSGRAVDVYVLDSEIDYWDKLTNTSTRMASRNSETNYSFLLNREHINPSTGVVKVRFVSTSTTTSHRLYLDRVLVGTVDISTGQTPGITAQDIWTYPDRTTTNSDTGDPVNPPSVDEIAAGILVTPAQKVVTDASGFVTANVNGSISVSGDVTLAANQPNYAPAKVSDIPTADIAEIKAKTDNLPVAPSSLTAQQVWEYATRTLSAFGFSVTVGTNNDKTGYTLTATPPTSEEIADKLLGRNLAGGSDGGRTVQDALRFSRNKVVVNLVAKTITVYEEDDTTIAWEGVLTTSAAAQHITGLDPS